MKKIVLLCAGILLLASAVAFSQAEQKKITDVFVKTVPVVKVYTHQLGYKVIYVKSTLEMGTLYLPLTWFGKAAGKGDLVWEDLSEPTYFSIFWADGKFDHIVLHVPNNLSSPIWGELEDSPDVAAKFNVEEPQLNF
jgi:hypothetical protein